MHICYSVMGMVKAHLKCRITTICMHFDSSTPCLNGSACGDNATH